MTSRIIRDIRIATPNNHPTKTPTPSTSPPSTSNAPTESGQTSTSPKTPRTTQASETTAGTEKNTSETTDPEMTAISTLVPRIASRMAVPLHMGCAVEKRENGRETGRIKEISCMGWIRGMGQRRARVEATGMGSGRGNTRGIMKSFLGSRKYPEQTCENATPQPS